MVRAQIPGELPEEKPPAVVCHSRDQNYSDRNFRRNKHRPRTMNDLYICRGRLYLYPDNADRNKSVVTINTLSFSATLHGTPTDRNYADRQLL
jgi:hypothetical protein